MNFRRLLRAHGIRSLIKYRVFAHYDHVHNPRIDANLHHQRSLNESTNSLLKRSYGEAVRAQDWFRQFRELAS